MTLEGDSRQVSEIARPFESVRRQCALLTKLFRYQTTYRAIVHDEGMNRRYEDGLVGVARNSLGHGHCAVIRFTFEGIQPTAPASSARDDGVRDAEFGQG